MPSKTVCWCWSCVHTHTHPFNGLLSGTTQLSQYQNGKTSLDFTEARDIEWQWHQLGHMQVCTSLQTNNHASTPPLRFLQAGCPSWCPTNSIKALKGLILKLCSCSYFVVGVIIRFLRQLLLASLLDVLLCIDSERDVAKNPDGQTSGEGWPLRCLLHWQAVRHRYWFSACFDYSKVNSVPISIIHYAPHMSHNRKDVRILVST